MNRLISRYSFSLFAVGLVLLYSGYQTKTQGGSESRMVLCCIGAVLCFALGLYGLSGRYRG